jgi:hypothetical protein
MRLQMSVHARAQARCLGVPSGHLVVESCAPLLVLLTRAWQVVPYRRPSEVRAQNSQD